mmetsp:Transcript_25493/g.58814  ORF Transcript_25493/g.58814 Transcript_25493/m.58814 type:complete len:239 (+) Transcript_25493:1140-1856(+)
MAVFHPLLKLFVCLLALLLQAGKELAVQIQLGLCVLKHLGFLDILFVGICQVLVKFFNPFLATCDLRLFGGLQPCIVSCGLLFSRLGSREIILEVREHLLENSEDLTALWSVALEARDGKEGRCCLHVSQEVLESKSIRFANGTACLHGKLSDSGLLEEVCHLLKLSEFGVVLAEYDQRLLRCFDGLEEVCLLFVEFLVVLDPQFVGLTKSLVISLNFLHGRLPLDFKRSDIGSTLTH